MEIERKQFTTKVQGASDKGEVTALVSCYSVDRANEKVMPGAFKASLEKKLPKVCWAHDWSKIIGKTLEAHETAEGLVVKAKINLDTTAGREAFSDIKFHSENQEWSIGYRVVKDSFDKKAGTRNLEEIELFEVSAVLSGMNPDTSTLSIKNAANASEEAMSALESKELSEEMSKPIRPNFGGNPKGQWPQVEAKSYAQRFVESKEYGDFLRSHSSNSESASVTFDVDLKTLMTTTTGWPVENTRSGLVVPYAVRPVQVTDVIPTLQTTQNAFVYLEQTSFSNTAVETAEGAAKPEGVLALTERTSPVRKIPVHIPVTDEQLEDVPGVMEWIEQQLGFMVRQRLDSQIVNGDGLGVNLLGILATPGIQTQAKGADPTPDAIAKAMTKIRVTGRAQPSALLINPADWQEVQLLRTTDGIYIAGSPWDMGPSRIWGISVVESDAVPEGTAICGDFANFTRLVERKSLTIKVGYSGDQFLSNTRTVLAELRVAFVVLRPAAICTITNV